MKSLQKSFDRRKRQKIDLKICLKKTKKLKNTEKNYREIKNYIKKKLFLIVNDKKMNKIILIFGDIQTETRKFNYSDYIAFLDDLDKRVIYTFLVTKIMFTYNVSKN